MKQMEAEAKNERNLLHSAVAIKKFHIRQGKSNVHICRRAVHTKA